MLMLRMAALFAALLVSGELFAGSFSVAPVRLEVKMPKRAVSIEVQNTGDLPAQIQVERYRWIADNDGDDRLEASDDVIATPPIFTLAPGQRQIVRVLLFASPDPTREGTYRVVLQETALNDPPPNGVRALLRISMPLFVDAPEAKPNLKWTLQRDGAGYWLSAENIGNAHAQITAARSPGGQEIKATGYLLPGEKRRLAVDAPVDSVLITLRDQPEQKFPVHQVP